MLNFDDVCGNTGYTHNTGDDVSYWLVFSLHHSNDAPDNINSVSSPLFHPRRDAYS